MPLRFDPLAPTVLNGDVQVQVIDPDGNPNQVLEINRPWRAQIEWFIDGPTVSSLGGNWHIELYLESIGPGFEGLAGTDTVNLTNIFAPLSNPTHLVYRSTINVPAGTPPDPRVYKITALVTYTNLFNNNMAMAGFSEGPMIQFYSPV